MKSSLLFPRFLAAVATVCCCAQAATALESPFIYGVFGQDPNPTEFLQHVAPAGPAWITASVAVGANTNDLTGEDFRFLSDAGHTVICRINHGYFPNGTIPLPAQYDDFAARCASFVSNSPGCFIWTIGNELNIAGEWPVDFNLKHAAYVSPSNYAVCFRKVYNAIKAVQPHAKVLPQAPACFSGPYGANSQNLTWLGTNYTHDANPLNWVTHLRSMLTNIANTGPLDGIALHVSSRGYGCAGVHSTEKRSAGGQSLYWSFYVYRDWVNLGIPSSLRSLPLYATECNGYYYWKGGHPENPAATYQGGWMQAVYAEVNRYNQHAFATNGPIFRCFNLYRWGPQDEWGIDRGDNPYKPDILSDLDEAVGQKYRWPANPAMLLTPIGLNFMHMVDGVDDSVPICDWAGVVPQSGWVNLTQGGTGNNVPLGGGVTVTWATPGGETHAFASMPVSPGDYALLQGYLDTGSPGGVSTTNTVSVAGLKFPLYNVIVYSAGDNGSATRVGQYTLTTSSGSGTKYVRDEGGQPDFDGNWLEADATSGGPGAAAGNYCVFRNVRGSSFTLKSCGQYASDGNPRGPLNALQIVPVDVVPTLSDPQYTNGEFRCFVNGATNANYVVQASTNLTDWSALQTNAAPFLFTDPGATGLPRRFYRALFR